MSHPIFLIDLASARPPTSQPSEQWPALAKEHSNQLTRCIRRIIAHSNVDSLTTHVFDSTVLAQSGKVSTKPLQDAIEDLNRIPGHVARIDTTGEKHPTARGILAGLTDAAPEDNFSEFYPEANTVRDIYIFARAPATRCAHSAFIGGNEIALSALERGLADTPYLSNKFKELAKRGDRLIWVDSTPRRGARVGDVDPEVVRVFSKWLLSFGSNFRLVTLHSFLIDRRIIPAKTMVKSLWDGSLEYDMGLGELVEVFCLQDSQLLRCFTACMNGLDEEGANEDTKRTALVLSGLVRNYETEELSKFGAFDTAARMLTPASLNLREDDESLNSSIFAGMMVDLARQNMSLVADFFQVGGPDGFTRYQTLLQPITPLSAVLRKVSRTETSVIYNNSPLPQSFEEWKSWDKLENVKDCDIADSAIDASAKFFETYLPTLFSTDASGNTALRGVRSVKHSSKKTGMSQSDKMLLSLEGGAALLPDNNHRAFAGSDDGGSGLTKPSKQDHVAGSKPADRDFIIRQLKAQQDIPNERKRQMGSDAAPPKQLQTPEKSNKDKSLEGSPRGTGTFTWRRPNQVVAPSRDDIQKCIDVHSHHKDDEMGPNKVYRKKHKSARNRSRASDTVARSESIASPTILRRSGQVYMLHADIGSANNLEFGVNRTDLYCDLDSGICLPQKVKTRDSSETRQLSRSVGKDQKIPEKIFSAHKNNKRKADALAGQEPESSKRHRSSNDTSRNAGEDLSSQCELKHGKKVGCFIQAFEECVNKLRKEDYGAIEAIVWEGVTVLSSLAEALSLNHPLQCDMDRKINLNLKIPKAVSEAVQEVQNKVTNDGFSPNTVLRQMWETILSAFEQAMWHLASARRTAINKPSNKRVNRQVRGVSNILSCVQFMAETASNSRRQPVSFRNVFSKLFSTVFVHLCRKDSGQPIPQILGLFGEYEEAVPAPLQTANTKGNTIKSNDEGKERQTDPRTGGTPHYTQLSGLESTRNAYPVMPVGKDRLRNKPSLKITNERNRAPKRGHSAMGAQARESTTKFTLGRSQFAKEFEALQNAMKSQTRLPLQLKKNTNKLKTQSKGGKQGISSGASDTFTSRVQSLSASILSAPVADKGVAGEPDEDSVGQTPPPTFPSAKNDKVFKRNTARDTKVSSVELIANTGEGNMSSSTGQKKKEGHEQKQVRTKKKKGKLARDELEKITPGILSNKPSSVPSGQTMRRQVRELSTAEKHREQSRSVEGMDVTLASADNVMNLNLASADDLRPTKPKHDEITKTPQIKTPGNQKRTVSRSARYVNPSPANQVLEEKVKEQESIDTSHEVSCRLTRSQAKQAAAKRILEPSTQQRACFPASSGHKKRRRKQVYAEPKHRRDFSGLHECSPTSSSPMTRSQAKAAEKNASLQLRNRSLPRRAAMVKSATGTVIGDSESPSMQYPVDTPRTPEIKPCTPAQDVFGTEKASPATPRSVLSPQTPVTFAGKQEVSAIRRIVNSSLEKRKGQLEGEDFIPETPVAPKPSTIVPPGGKSVRRMLTF